MTSATTNWTVTTNGDTSWFQTGPGGTVSGVAPGETVGVRLTLPARYEVDRDLSWLGWYAESGGGGSHTYQPALQTHYGDDADFDVVRGGNLSIAFRDVSMNTAFLYGTVAMSTANVLAGSSVTCLITELTMPDVVDGNAVASSVTLDLTANRMETWELNDDTGLPTSWP